MEILFTNTNHIWVADFFIAYKGASYIRGLKLLQLHIGNRTIAPGAVA